MAKRGKPGRGVRPTDLGKLVDEHADELFEKSDAVVIVAVRFSGQGDSTELVACTVRGSGLARSKAIDRICEYDEPKVQLDGSFIDDESEENEED